MSRRHTVPDARQLPPGSVLRAQVCVVGSGPAGATTALELARRGVDVLLLEGGGDRPGPDDLDAYRGEMAEGTSHDALELVRERRLGGTSSQWGGRCGPLDAEDFEVRPWVPGSGWPLTLQQMQPYYARAGAALGLGRPHFLAQEAWGSAPVGPDPRGATTGVDTERIWRWSPPVRFGAVVGDAAAQGRLRVLAHATAVRLEQEADGRVSGVLVRTAPQRELRVVADVVVVAAGALESTRLLLSSTDAHPAGLGNAHDLVGRHYTTHPVGETGALRLRGPGRALAAGFRRDADGVYTMRGLALTAHAQERLGLLNCRFAAWYPDPGDPSHRDPVLSAYAVVRAGLAVARADFKSSGLHARYAHLPSPGRHLALVAAGAPQLARFGRTWVEERYLSQRRLPSMMRLGASQLRLRFDAEQAPDPDSRVVLGEGVDALGVRRLLVHTRVSDADRASVLRSLHVVRDALASTGLGELDLPSEEEFAQLRVVDGTHPLGLLRMAASEREGVVDADGRVFGAPNAFVVSSACFPTGGAVGPTMTIVAMACRTADRVAADLGAA